MLYAALSFTRSQENFSARFDGKIQIGKNNYSTGDGTVCKRSRKGFSRLAR